jgi:hypothetical protein
VAVLADEPLPAAVATVIELQLAGALRAAAVLVVVARGNVRIAGLLADSRNG